MSRPKMEALQLTYADLDFDRNLIHVKEAKTNQTRILPMNKSACMAAKAAGERLFSSINRDHASRKFGVYVRRAGFQGFKLHSLRHSFATNLVAAGCDIYTVSRLLGHSDIRTSLINAKANIDVLRRAVNQLDPSSGGLISVGELAGEKESPDT